MKLKKEKNIQILRRAQIQSIFLEGRNLLMGAIEQQVDRRVSSPQFQLILDKIDMNFRQRNIQASFNYLNQLDEVVRNNADASTLVFIHSQKVSKLIKLVFRNQLIQQNNFSYRILSPEQEIQMTDSLLTILNALQYSSLNEETFSKILKSFWQILQLKNINVQSIAGLHLLQKTLKILIKMMSLPNEIVYHKLKELGVGSKIVELTQDKRLVQNDGFCYVLSQLTSLYLQHENTFETQKKCEINGVHILGTQSHQKQKLLAFSLGLLNFNHAKILQNSLVAISNIIERFQYFVDSIPDKSYKRVCLLMDSKERKIQKTALQIMDMAIYGNSELADKLVKQNFIINLIQKQLLKELKNRDEFSKGFVQNCAVLLCNLTLVNNKKLRMSLFEHTVWELAYNNIRLDSSLFPLVIVFQYFFEITPRQKIMSYLQSYIQKISQLQMSLVDKMYQDLIRMTLTRIFYLLQDYLSEGMVERYIVILHECKLEGLISQEIRNYSNDLL